MKNKIFFIVFSIFSSAFVLAQDVRFEEAKTLFENQNYSAAQAVFKQIINSGNGDETVLYYHAKCSKELFLSDAIQLYQNYTKTRYIIYFDTKLDQKG